MKNLFFIFLFLPFLAFAQAEANTSTGDLDLLVEQFGGKGIVYGQFVGIAGTTPDEYKAYAEFVQKANLEQLTSYLNHHDASVRAYAFRGIVMKYPQAALKVHEELGEDFASINCMLGGCVMYTSTVSDFRDQLVQVSMLGTFNPSKKKNKQKIKF